MRILGFVIDHAAQSVIGITGDRARHGVARAFGLRGDEEMIARNRRERENTIFVDVKRVDRHRRLIDAEGFSDRDRNDQVDGTAARLGATRADPFDEGRRGLPRATRPKLHRED